MESAEWSKLPLHARAAQAVAALACDGSRDEDARTVAAYYRSCLVAADRAARQLLVFAAARGLGDGE